MHAIRNILIVGGGTAGWLTAAYLARTLNAAAPGGVGIELVESDTVAPIGVGEATFPSIRGTLAAIGLDEGRFLHGANATFKQGIRFVDWVRTPGAPGADHYFHPFSLPSQRPDSPELLPYWLLGHAPPGVAYADAVTMQKRVVDAMRGPKRAGDADYTGPMNYAYHFDAPGFAAVLAGHAQQCGVRRTVATITGATRDERGHITAVHTCAGESLSADLYIDCTGMRAELIGGAMGSPFRSLADVLFVDRALTVQVPYARPGAPIPPCTIATAQEAGWTWDIALRDRRGTGYVYSSAHSDDAAAEQVLRHYLGTAGEGLTPRLLKFETGYRPQPWRGNCVAVGLSGGFFEPLESTGIALIEMAAYLIAHLFPADGDLERTARTFNRMMSARCDRILDFLKLHYCISQRRDHAFWVDNADPAGIPDSLRDQLAMWRCRPPHRLDFITDIEMFLPASWQYILYGMEYGTDLQRMRASHPRIGEARQAFAMIREVAGHAVRDLPDHRALVEHMVQPHVQAAGAGAA